MIDTSTGDPMMTELFGHNLWWYTEFLIDLLTARRVYTILTEPRTMREANILNYFKFIDCKERSALMYTRIKLTIVMKNSYS